MGDDVGLRAGPVSNEHRDGTGAQRAHGPRSTPSGAAWGGPGRPTWRSPAGWSLATLRLSCRCCTPRPRELGPGHGQGRVSARRSAGGPSSCSRRSARSPPRTHRAPVALGVELREVDVRRRHHGTAGGPTSCTSDDPLPVIEAAVRDDLPGALRHLVTGAGRRRRSAAGWSRHRPSPADAALAPARRRRPARPRRDRRCSSPLRRSASIRTRSSRRPEFAGQLGSAEELLTRVGSLETPFGSVGSRHASCSRTARRRCTPQRPPTASPAPTARSCCCTCRTCTSTRSASRLARDLARNFDVDAVVDTGDITSFGFEPEAAFTDLLADFEVPYYVVAGNHDSDGVRRRLAESDDVISLDDEVVDIAGLRVLGIADPTATALRRIPRDELDETYRAQFDRTAELVDRERPDLLLVHNPVQLRPVIGQVPVAAAGHLHRTELEIVDGTVIAVVGSSGATGLGNLLADTSAPYQFELLRFVDERLVAVDQIELRGDGGDFRLDRRLIDPDGPRRRAVADRGTGSTSPRWRT